MRLYDWYVWGWCWYTRRLHWLIGKISQCLSVLMDQDMPSHDWREIGEEPRKKLKIYIGAPFPLKRLGKLRGQMEELKALPLWEQWVQMTLWLAAFNFDEIGLCKKWVSPRPFSTNEEENCQWFIHCDFGSRVQAGLTVPGWLEPLLFFFGKAQVTRFDRCRVKRTNTIFPMNPIIFSVRFCRVWRFSGKSTAL